MDATGSVQSPPTASLVTFLSDFGTTDVFVGLCHGVLTALAPQARIVDLTHAVPPQDVLTGACRLRDCVAYLPPAVHLAVVDPGVGTARRCLILQAGTGGKRSWFVGPDNGLLLPAARQLGGVLGAWSMTPEGASATFHGRDVFAPAAARLATGVPPGELGTAIDPESVVDVAEPAPATGDGALQATVRDIDTFGNVQLFARQQDLDALLRQERLPPPAVGGQRLVVTVAGTTSALVRVTTFAELERNQMGLITDSFGWLALVVAAGDAAAQLGTRRGDQVLVSVAHDGEQA